MNSIAAENMDTNTKKIECANCRAFSSCISATLSEDELLPFENNLLQRIKLKKGRSIYLKGISSESFHIVRLGFLKTTLMLKNGEQHVLGFKMEGDILGLENLKNNSHQVSVTALEDTILCSFNISSLHKIFAHNNFLRDFLYKSMRREISCNQQMSLLLAKMSAEERLCSFLCELSESFVLRGYSATSFNLRMSRNDIASYLGLRMETICRCFTRLQGSLLINTSGSSIEIVDLLKIKEMACRL